MQKATETMKTMSFVKFMYPEEQQIVAAPGRVLSKLKLPKECEFYFFDAEYKIGKDGNPYPVGRKKNKSNHYFKVKEYYPNTDHFRVYFMRCHGWSEEDIWNKNSERVAGSGFDNFNEKFPNGIVILGQVITDPGKTGIIISAERIIRDYENPSAEVLKAYGK